METNNPNLFATYARQAASMNLLKCSSGNLSCRLNNDIMMISATRTWLSELTEADVVKIPVNSAKFSGPVKPSGEYKLHQAIYQSRPDINVVLHFQSEYATTLAAMNIIPDYNVIIEVPVYIGKVAHLPYAMPGSDALAGLASAAAKESTMIQLANHGQVSMGTSFRDAIQKAVFFELACSVLVRSNFKAVSIPQEAINELSGYRK